MDGFYHSFSACTELDYLPSEAGSLGEGVSAYICRLRANRENMEENMNKQTATASRLLKRDGRGDVVPSRVNRTGAGHREQTAEDPGARKKLIPADPRAAVIPGDQSGWESLDGGDDLGGIEDWERWQSLDGWDLSAPPVRNKPVPRQALDELYALRVRLERVRELKRVLEGQGLAAQELEAETTALESAIEGLEPLAENFLLGVEDPFLRQAFRMRLGQGLSWRQISGTLGGYMSEEGLKKACNRYLARRSE